MNETECSIQKKYVWCDVCNNYDLIRSYADYLNVSWDSPVMSQIMELKKCTHYGLKWNEPAISNMIRTMRSLDVSSFGNSVCVSLSLCRIEHSFIEYTDLCKED